MISISDKTSHHNKTFFFYSNGIPRYANHIAYGEHNSMYLNLTPTSQSVDGNELLRAKISE